MNHPNPDHPAKHGDPLAPNAVMMTKVMNARQRAPIVAEKLLATIYDPSVLREASDILKLLTWEPKE